MGNNSNQQRTPENFRNACHPGLLKADYNVQQKMLVISVRRKENADIWKKDVDRLMGSKYLFIPHQFLLDDRLIQSGCCNQDDYAEKPVIYKACYLPFLYTLQREILVRRQKNSFFREQQLWKLINYLCKAVAEWQSVYPEEKLGTICTSNVLLNSEGQTNIITKLSFFDQNYGSMNDYYLPPESRGSQSIKFALNPYKDRVAIEASSVYCIGAVVLEAMTLTLADFEPAQMQQKKVMMRQMSYGLQLKDAILSMVDENQLVRYKIQYLMNLSKTNKRKVH